MLNDNKDNNKKCIMYCSVGLLCNYVKTWNAKPFAINLLKYTVFMKFPLLLQLDCFDLISFYLILFELHLDSDYLAID